MARTAYSKDEFPSNAVRSTFDATVGAGATAFNVSPATNWPSSSFWVVANRTGDNSSKEELMYVETNSSGALTNVNRAQGGTSAAEHEAGDPIEVVWPGVAADEVSQLVSETLGAITTAGDLVRASDSDTLERLPAGSNDDVLRVSGGTPAFGSLPADSVTQAQVADEAIRDEHFDNTNQPMSRIFRVADATARDALGSPREGDIAYLEDVDFPFLRSDGAWVPFSAQLIAETELSSATATVEFESIPQDFRHLLVVWTARSDRAASGSDALSMFYNDDTTTTNYIRQLITANGTTIAGSRTNDALAAEIPAASSGTNVLGGGHIYIPDYSDASRRQIAVVTYLHDDAATRWGSVAYRWATTDAITKITFDAGNGDLVADSVFSLYGLR